jgi:peptidoglycan LD-endopeptidase CwlK
MRAYPTIALGSSGHYVRILQLNLQGLAINYTGFTVNGVFDEKTMAAARGLQSRLRLKMDGVVGPNTWNALINNVKRVQQLIVNQGYSVGELDGIYGPMTTGAVMQFQTGKGLYPSGIVEPRTRKQLFSPAYEVGIESRPSSSDLTSLHPSVAAMARALLELTQANQMDVRVYAAFRSWGEQDLLFAQGRWSPGSIVTNARGGESYHNWGLAFDAAPYVNGVISQDIQLYKIMGQLGQQVGLRWGGTFKTLLDYPHFEYTFGLSTWDLLSGATPPA